MLNETKIKIWIEFQSAKLEEKKSRKKFRKRKELKKYLFQKHYSKEEQDQHIQYIIIKKRR